MPHRTGGPTLVDLVKLLLEDKASQDAALSYESLYEKVSNLYGATPSKRDFQVALDQLQHGRKLIIEKDSSDRRRVKIWRGEGATISHEQDVALIDFFRKNPEYAPVYVRPSGAIRIREIDENDVGRELTRIFRHTTPLVIAFKEIAECEKLGKKPDDSTVRRWWQQYERFADAIAKATATEFSEALRFKRAIKPKNIVDRVIEILGKPSQQVSP